MRANASNRRQSSPLCSRVAQAPPWHEKSASWIHPSFPNASAAWFSALAKTGNFGKLQETRETRWETTLARESSETGPGESCGIDLRLPKLNKNVYIIFLNIGIWGATFPGPHPARFSGRPTQETWETSGNYRKLGKLAGETS